MAEKCKKCGHKISENKNGYYCPACGDYFCYDCTEDAKKDEKTKERSKCPHCDEFMKNIWPL